LPVRILRIKFDATILRDECVNACGKTFTQWSRNPSAAGISYGIEFCSSLFSGQFFHVFDRGRLLEVLAEYRDIDVFGESPDEAVSLRQRSAALEEKARAPMRNPVIENI
jgi:trimethylamine:corrinoid methyltransferase-like protein